MTEVVPLEESSSYSTSVNHHPTCFALPGQRGGNKTKYASAAQFIEDALEDRSVGGNKILPAQADELAAAFESKKVKGGKNKGEGGAGGDEESPMAALKRAFEARSSGEPVAKKIKSDPSNKNGNGNDNISCRAVDFYGEYHKVKNDELKDLLRWNRQVMTGTKDTLLLKVIDGALFGRLARCALCGGRLKIQTAHTQPGGKGGTQSSSSSSCLGAAVVVVCSGSFDEASSRRIDCAYTATPEAAPRWQPWFTSEPSEAEAEEMDRLDAEAKGEDGGAGVAGAGAAATQDSDDVAQLQTAASTLDWNLTSREGLRAAAKDMVQLLHDHHSVGGGGKTVDLPPDAAVQKIGQLIAVNKKKTAADLIPIIVSQFGFVQDKQKKAELKQAAIETIVKHPANAALVAAFQELGELYFKSGNANAGVAYKKAVSALAGLDFCVTEDNAMSLCKGKTKVPCIGKGSAEKMYEFVTTGTLAKLEEKRADAS